MCLSSGSDTDSDPHPKYWRRKSRELNRFEDETSSMEDDETTSEEDADEDLTQQTGKEQKSSATHRWSIKKKKRKRESSASEDGEDASAESEQKQQTCHASESGKKKKKKSKQHTPAAKTVWSIRRYEGKRKDTDSEEEDGDADDFEDTDNEDEEEGEAEYDKGDGKEEMEEDYDDEYDDDEDYDEEDEYDDGYDEDDDYYDEMYDKKEQGQEETKNSMDEESEQMEQVKEEDKQEKMEQLEQKQEMEERHTEENPELDVEKNQEQDEETYLDLDEEESKKLDDVKYQELDEEEHQELDEEENKELDEENRYLNAEEQDKAFDEEKAAEEKKEWDEEEDQEDLKNLKEQGQTNKEYELEQEALTEKQKLEEEEVKEAYVGEQNEEEKKQDAEKQGEEEKKENVEQKEIVERSEMQEQEVEPEMQGEAKEQEWMEEQKCLEGKEPEKGSEMEETEEKCQTEKQDEENQNDWKQAQQTPHEYAEGNASQNLQTQSSASKAESWSPLEPRDEKRLRDDGEEDKAEGNSEENEEKIDSMPVLQEIAGQQDLPADPGDVLPQPRTLQPQIYVQRETSDSRLRNQPPQFDLSNVMVPSLEQRNAFTAMLNSMNFSQLMTEHRVLPEGQLGNVIVVFMTKTPDERGTVLADTEPQSSSAGVQGEGDMALQEPQSLAVADEHVVSKESKSQSSVKESSTESKEGTPLRSETENPPIRHLSEVQNVICGKEQQQVSDTPDASHEALGQSLDLPAESSKPQQKTHSRRKKRKRITMQPKSSSKKQKVSSQSKSSAKKQNVTSELNPSARMLMTSSVATTSAIKQEQPPEPSTSTGRRTKFKSIPRKLPRLEDPTENPYRTYAEFRTKVKNYQFQLKPCPPKPKEEYKDLMVAKCDYLIKGNEAISTPVPRLLPPANLEGPMPDLFKEHEEQRYNLRLRHRVEWDRLKVHYEQEFLREQARAERARIGQAHPLSACTALRFQEMCDPEKFEVKEETGRSRTTGNQRQLNQWVDEIKTKFRTFKGETVARQMHEADSMLAAQRLQWGLKMQEYGLCSILCFPTISEQEVPRVQVVDFELFEED